MDRSFGHLGEHLSLPARANNFLSDIAADKESLAYVEKWIARNLAEPRKG